MNELFQTPSDIAKEKPFFSYKFIKSGGKWLFWNSDSWVSHMEAFKKSKAQEYPTAAGNIKTVKQDGKTCAVIESRYSETLNVQMGPKEESELEELLNKAGMKVLGYWSI